MSDVEVDVTADSGDRWYCEGGCERSYPFTVPRDYRAIASDHLLTLRVPFCPDCCAAADAVEGETFAEGLQGDEERPTMLAPDQAPYVDPAPTDGSIPLALRIVPRAETTHPAGFIAELIRRAQAAGYPSLWLYVQALEDEVVAAHELRHAR